MKFSLAVLKRIRWPGPSEIVLACVPFLVGPLCAPPDIRSEFFGAYLYSYILFIATFVSWELLRCLIRREQVAARSLDKKEKSALLHSKKRDGWRSVVPHLPTIALTLLLLLTFKPFREVFGEVIFYAALITMAVSALSDALIIRRWYLIGTLCGVIATTGIGILSFEPGLPNIYLQPGLISLGIASIIGATTLTSLLSSTASTDKYYTVYARSIELLIISSAVAPAILVYMKHLDKNFLLLFIPLIILSATLSKVRQCGAAKEALPASIRKDILRGAILYLVVFVIVILRVG